MVVDAPPAVEYPSLLIEACSSVVAPDRCGAAAPGEEPTVEVKWRSPDLVEVRVIISGQTALRALSFPPEDPPEARWRAVGLVAGAMVVELGGGLPPAELPTTEPAAGVPSGPGPTAAAPSPEAAPDSPPPSIDPRRERRDARSAPVDTSPTSPASRLLGVGEPGLHWAVGAGALGGTGMTRAPWRWGGFLRSSLSWSQWGVGATVAFSASSEREGLSARWISVAVGPRLTQFVGRWSFGAHVGLAGEQWSVDLAGNEAEPADSAGRLYLGARGGAELGFLLSPNTRPVLGVELTSSPGQDVYVAGTEVTSNPVWSGAVVVGMDFGDF